MDIFSQPEILERYLEAHSSDEDPVLTELSRHTHLKEVHPRMLSGHVLGAFLTLFSKLVSPTHILEVGTYTGYSAICLAKGLKQGGKLTTLELNDELRNTALTFFEKAGIGNNIELINGDALQIIPGLPGPFDLIFIDANKENYPAYYEMIVEKVRPGGYILADNVLWGGKVLGDAENDSSTKAIHQFNQLVTKDPRVENLLIPIRDGLMVINKL
ncbi:MAG: O-methyltransferase [Bacteroidetes bacterium]|nr:O-methyltransferase [Bacteroidota bacterium]